MLVLYPAGLNSGNAVGACNERECRRARAQQQLVTTALVPVLASPRFPPTRTFISMLNLSIAAPVTFHELVALRLSKQEHGEERISRVLARQNLG